MGQEIWFKEREIPATFKDTEVSFKSQLEPLMGGLIRAGLGQKGCVEIHMYILLSVIEIELLISI